MANIQERRNKDGKLISYPENRAVKKIRFAPDGDNAAFTAIKSMAECGTAPPGGILPGQRFCFRPGYRRTHAPRQRNDMVDQIQQATRPAPCQRPRLPPHNGINALLQRRGQRIYFQASGSCSGKHHRKYLCPRYGSRRQKERRHTSRRFPEKSLNFRGELN